MKHRNTLKRLAALLLCLVFAGGALAEAGWSCPGCGAEGLTGNFCPDCGEARPAIDWSCPNCGAEGLTGRFCPECGTARDAQPAGTASGGLTLDQLLIPTQVIAQMNRCIEAACEGIAADCGLDADALFEACKLEMSEVAPGVIYFDNPDWSIELYFYYENENNPTVDMEAKHWCIAVGERADDPELMRSVAFSATVSLLYMLDPDIDAAAALEVLSRGEQGGQYVGNGYQFTYLITGNGTETQLMVQRT